MKVAALTVNYFKPMRIATPIMRLKGIVLAIGLAASAAAADLRVVSGLVNPESVAVGADGRIYVSQIGEPNKDGDGKITVIEKSGETKTFAKGLDDPRGLVRWKHDLFAADKKRIWRIDGNGKTTVFAEATDFPQSPGLLNDLTIDSRGNLYVSDGGDALISAGKGAIFKITRRGKISLVIDASKNPSIKSPNGLLFERPNKLFVADFVTGELNRLDVTKLTVEKIADGFGGGDGLARLTSRMLFISNWKDGRIWSIDLKKKGAQPALYPQIFQSAGDICLSRNGKYILVPDTKAGTLTWLPR